jgi:hypothetical protein
MAGNRKGFLIPSLVVAENAEDDQQPVSALTRKDKESAPEERSEAPLADGRRERQRRTTND